MSRVLIIAVVGSLVIHGGFLAGGQLLSARPVAKPVEEKTPTIELLALPPSEPEVPDVVDASAEAPDLSQVALPTQTDTPSIVPSSFVQQIQPPPPPGTRPTGVISIPTGLGATGGGGGLKNIFDLANLDQRPEPRFQPRPVYPPSLKRAGVSGDVTVGFIVDASGDTRDAYIVRSTQREFEAAVLDAVARWKFKAGRKGGVAVNTRVEIPIPFSLQKD